MKKKLLIILLCFCVILTLLFNMVMAAELSPWESITGSLTGNARIVSALLETSNGMIYAGTWGGVWVYNGSDWTESSSMPNVNTLLEASDGNIYAGANNGVWSYDGLGWTKITGTPMTDDTINVRVLLEASDKTIYVGTYDAGVWTYDDGVWTDITDTDEMTGETLFVSGLLETEDNTIYATTWGGGVWTYNGTKWINVTGTNMTGNSLYASPILEASDGTLYVGTLGGAWAYKNNASWINVSPPVTGSSRNVSALLETTDGNIYAGTTLGGLWMYDSNEWTNVTGSDMTGYALYVTTLLEASDDTIYVGTFNGLWAASPLLAGLPPIITTISLDSATVGATYGVSLMATGDVPITWSDDDNLPTGLTLNATTGAISGTPTASGTYSFVVTATNSAGSDSKNLNIVVHADAATTYIITFDANGGKVSPTSATTGADGRLASLPTPTRGGYTFNGWFDVATGGTQITTGTVFSVNTTVFSQWIYNGGSSALEPTQHTLIFETNGGSAVASITAASGVVIDVTQYTSLRNGYRFVGWYADAALTIPVTSKTLTKNTTVYAKWQITIIPPDFTDYPHYAYVIGYPDGGVHPSANITRAEVATIFFRLLWTSVRDDNKTTANSFSDVGVGMWYNTAVSTLAKMGIINGRDNGQFDGESFITRAEFAAIAARFGDEQYTGSNQFTDTNGHWAQELISRAASNGWILRYDDGTFKPEQNITRAEAMTLLNRVLQRQPEGLNDLLQDMKTWTDNMNTGIWFYLAVQEATNSHEFIRKTDNFYEVWTKLVPNPDWNAY